MMAGTHENHPIEPDSAEVERLARQRKRSIAIAVSLGVLVVLFYVATLVKMSSDAPPSKTPNAATTGKAAKQ